MFKWFPLFIALSGVVYSAAHAQSMMTSADSTQTSRKNYIEDIFIWKISDELKLSPKEEKLFIRKALKIIFRSGMTLKNALLKMEEENRDHAYPAYDTLARFIKSSERGICR